MAGCIHAPTWFTAPLHALLSVRSNAGLALEDNSEESKVVRAVRFKSFGDPSVLELAEVAAPAIAAPISQICGLGQAQEAYRAVAAGSTGRVVLRPQE